MSQRWYVKTDRGADGPFPVKELVRRARAGQLGTEDQLSQWKNGPWHSPTENEELQAELAERMQASHSKSSKDVPEKPGVSQRSTSRKPRAGRPRSTQVAKTAETQVDSAEKDARTAAQMRYYALLACFAIMLVGCLFAAYWIVACLAAIAFVVTLVLFISKL